MPDETAMLLTQQEWMDLAFICRSYLVATEGFKNDQSWDSGLKRRRTLAERIEDAAAE